MVTLTVALEKKIPAFTEGHGGKLNAISRGLNAVFMLAKIRTTSGHLSSNCTRRSRCIATDKTQIPILPAGTANDVKVARL